MIMLPDQKNDLQDQCRWPWLLELFLGTIPKRILFRVDAGRIRGLSFGHASRCLSFAKVLQHYYGSEAIFLMRAYDDGVRFVRNAGYTVICMEKNLSYKDDAKCIVHETQKQKIDWICIDLPYEDIGDAYIEQAKKAAVGITFIDDLRFQLFDVDVYLNASVLAPERITRPVSGKPKCLLGIKYFLCDIPNNKKRERSHLDGDKKHIVLTCGGSDPSGLTLKIVRALVLLNRADVSVSVVLGPGFIQHTEIECLIQSNRDHFCVLSNPTSLMEILAESDGAICTGGRTMYELHCLHKPFFPIASIEHEIETIEGFGSHKLVRFYLTVWDDEDFLNKFELFICNL